MVKNRDISLDVVSGLLVIWMIIQHLLQWSHLMETEGYVFFSKLFFFFMAWFFFKGGMFAKHTNVKETIIMGGGKIVIAFFVFFIRRDAY